MSELSQFMGSHNEQITQSDHADQLSVVVDDAGSACWQICSGGVCVRNRCVTDLLEEYRALLVKPREAGAMIAIVLALRHNVPDATLLDWAELEQRLPPPPCRVRRRQLEQLWHVSQPALCRRLQRLAEAGLLDYETHYGMVAIHRLGPLPLIGDMLGSTAPPVAPIPTPDPLPPAAGFDL